MILLLCPSDTPDAELVRLKTFYLPHNIFVERNTKNEWEILAKLDNNSSIPIVYPYYPYWEYPNITTIYSNSAGGYIYDGTSQKIVWTPNNNPHDQIWTTNVKPL